MQSLAFPEQPLHILPEDFRLPQKKPSTPYETTTLENLLEEFSEEDHAFLHAFAAAAANPERKNGYLVGKGSFDEYDLSATERHVVCTHKQHPQSMVRYELQTFDLSRRITDFTRQKELITHIKSTGHDGLHLYDSAGRGLMLMGGKFVTAGDFAIRGLAAAVEDGLRDQGGNGSEAAAEYAAATGQPAFYMRSAQASTSHFFYARPFEENGRRGAQVCIVTLDGYTPPGQRARQEVQSRNVIPIRSYLERRQTPQALYAA